MGINRTSPDQYQLRFPPGLRDRIKAAADAAGRSMNAEIILRLENSFDQLPTAEEIEAYVRQNLRSSEWAAKIFVELRKPQPDIRRIVDFLEFMGVDIVSGIRRNRDDDSIAGAGQ